MKEDPLDEEVLEPVTLSADSASKQVGKRHPYAAWVLMGLLGLWSLAVWIYFTREREKPAVEEVKDDPLVEALPTAAAAATAPPARPTPVPVPTLRPLRVESVPPGASVLRNGRFLGVTPLLLLDPRAGEPLQITLAGHAPRMITLAQEELGEGLRVELEVQNAFIRVKLEPAGARLFVNSEPVTLPSDGRVNLPQREQVLRAEAEGHSPREIRVTPAVAYEREVDLRLSPLIPSSD